MHFGPLRSSRSRCAFLFRRNIAWLVAFAAIAGSVNGAAFGFLRALLNHFTVASRLPRALGVAATLNEVTFVLAPALASGLGVVGPIYGVLAIAVLGALPAIVVPTAPETQVDDIPDGRTSVLSPSIAMWLTCAAAGGSAIGAIEVGAVALALNYGYAPELAITLAVPLCVASIAGGMWTSVRNRLVSRKAVFLQLCVMSSGIALAAFGPSLATTVLGATLVGLVLAPLGTFYALILDGVAPPDRRPEVFSLLRTANAVGVIFASALWRWLL